MSATDSDVLQSRCDLQALYRSEVRTVYGYLLARCGDHHLAEDLATETFLNAADRFAQGRAHEVTPAWLMTAAKRRLIDYWRRGRSQRERIDRLGRESSIAVTDHDDGSRERVLAALATLPERQRAAVTMRYLDEQSVSEVADALEVSYQAAESLLARARRSFVVAFEAAS